MRQMFLSLTLALGLCVSSSGAFAVEGIEDATRSPGSVEEAEFPEQVSSDASRRPGKIKKNRKGRVRVKWQRKPGKPRGYVVPDEALRVATLPRPSGNLHLYNIAGKEDLKINIFNDDGSFNGDALKEASHLLRCKRTADERDIEPRLFVALSHVYDRFGKPLEVVSGYRNQRRQSSFHYQGTAADIRIAGVPPQKLQRFVESLDTGGMGIGLYPRVGFVHVDIRPLPSYRWIDYSRSNPNSPDKRPPRGWGKKKRGKLRS